jgi:hypothetical protein
LDGYVRDSYSDILGVFDFPTSGEVDFFSKFARGEVGFEGAGVDVVEEDGAEVAGDGDDVFDEI